MLSLSKLAILGPGLLGGSIALATRERSPHTRVAVWARREEAIAGIRSANIASVASTELSEVVADADLIVLCVPIGAMPVLAGAIIPFLKPSAVVTDVGSVKTSVVEELGNLFTGSATFVGSHPMAGSEKSGLGAASARLFEKAVCIVTPESRSEPAATHLIAEFWSLLGCQVRLLSPTEHDEIVALISHLPHLSAAALMNLVAAQNPEAFEFCGNGFRDSTRVAAGPAEMWTEIALTNRKPIRAAVEAMIEKLRELVTLLDTNDPKAMNHFLAGAQTQRERLRR